MKEKKYIVEYDGKVFPGWLEFGYYLFKNNLDYKFYPTSRIFFIREALQNKFKRRFTFTEVRKIINDKSWQTKSTPSQPYDKNKKEGPETLDATL